MAKVMSDNRRARRLLLRRAKQGKLRKGEVEKSYIDNRGFAYQYAWIARLSSFCNVISGCLKNGFPIVVSRLWYPAWACYPFFFVRKDLRVKDPISVLNHERIHVRQQRDIHLAISLPLVAICILAELLSWFNPIYLLCCIPFMPTIVYGFEMLRTWFNLHTYNSGLRRKGYAWRLCTFSYVRENTCFEREAISRATNMDYLLYRKFWAVIAYTGWRWFKNYGMK